LWVTVEEEISNILKHVIFAFRPLTLLELAIACEIQQDCQYASSIRSYSLDGIRGDIELCGPLLKVQSDGSVHLIHHSAKDFLLTLRSTNPQVSRLVVADTSAHMDIARACVSYLSVPELEVGPLDAVFWYAEKPRFHDILRQFPFLVYAAVYWYRHIQLAEKRLELWDVVRKSLDSKSKMDLSFQVHQFIHKDYLYAGNQTPLHVFARAGLQSFLKRLLVLENVEINAKDDCGWTALHWAAIKGHEAIARLLRDNGADITMEEQRGGLSAVDQAVLCGHTAVVRALLENLDPETESATSENAMLLAAGRGHVEIVNLLLDFGAEIVPFKGTTALHEAVEGRHIAVVELLLKRGANAEERNALGQTVLFVAACYGQADMSKLLIQAGVEIDANSMLIVNTSLRITALQGAIRNKQWAIVELLLRSGARFMEDVKIPSMTKIYPEVERNADFIAVAQTPTTTKLSPAVGRDEITGMPYPTVDNVAAPESQYGPSLHVIRASGNNADKGGNVNRDLVSSIPTHQHVVGLYNLGATGWLNAVVQLLMSIPDLRSELAEIRSTNGVPTSLTNALQDLFQHMSEAQVAFFPSRFFSALRIYLPRYSNNQAEDVLEFCDDVLNRLGQESKTSIVDCQFIETFTKGTFESIDTCIEPGAAGADLEPRKSSVWFRGLNAYVSSSTTDFRESILASLFEKRERVNGMWHNTDRVSYLPKYLVVRVHRINWLAEHQRKVIITTKVAFPLQLDATEFCTDELRRKLVPVKDKLKELWEKITTVQRERTQSGLGVEDAKYSQQVTSENLKELQQEITDNIDFENWTSIEAAKILSQVDPILAFDNGANKSGLYELRGIITHAGQSAEFGTYSTFVKQESENNMTSPEDGNWWAFDDHIVTKVNAEQVKMLASGGEYHQNCFQT
jgi:ubiquitin carboxyl-terminal hydrolase 14